MRRAKLDFDNDGENISPGEYLRQVLDKRGWTQADLASILGRDVNGISDIVTGKRSITIETARGLADAFETTVELWLNLEQSYRLSLLKGTDANVARRARLYSLAPITEMIRRGWIEPSNSPDILESQLLRFYGCNSLDEITQQPIHAARKSTSYSSELTPAQRAWLARAKQLAGPVYAAKFMTKNVPDAVSQLQRLLHEPREIRHIPRILAEAGIRLVIVQPLTNTRIDGACLWVGDSPVIALSMRFDRIDSFWFTLFHELDHCYKPFTSLDSDMDSVQAGSDKPKEEREADEFAQMHLVRKEALDNFIARKSPIYSSTDIIAFAKTMKVHPGIVVGQLQYRRELNWSKFRKLLVSVRDDIIASALTDGWGIVVPSLQ
jgi:HTH-type transcriptional regulator/antitoxin HigA